ncbi:hypothetical protein QJS10_CPB14g01545 [Acorus calamus]|uniref:Tyrosine-protein kinase catalytic domain-containing protein n=1 Tax=Acorus calamus TaxID=4465 RepID=A0AAV9DAU4_ACOCL|nr:hypothetical protein QJS10_CPB14g01545 [Acorus calamus]
MRELKIATRNKRLESNQYDATFGWIDEHALKPALPKTGMQVIVHRVPVCPASFGGHEKWLAKIKHLGKLRHPNLVKLIGYCAEDWNYLVVHEFMPNGRLGGRHFRRSSDFKPLSWKFRIKIALGVAKDDPNPMCDVYSFGVVLLEILSGRTDCKFGHVLAQLDLMDWAARYLNNKSDIIFDPQLEGEYSLMEAQKLTSLVFQCIYLKRAYRPSMAQIVKALEALQDG